MIITNSSTDAIRFVPENPTEQMLMVKFPGLIKEDGEFKAPNRINVLYNLVSRLRKNFKVKLPKSLAEELEKPIKFNDLPPFKFFTDPLKFQLIALRFLYTMRGGGLLLEPGMGKTKVILDFIALMNFTKSLIVCPKPLMAVWYDEGQKHRPDKKVYVIQSTNWAEEKAGILAADIVVVNYNKAVSMMPDFITTRWDFLGLDEALIKDPKSQRTKNLTILSKHIPHKCLMSGTLINNSALDAFAPVRFLEPSLVGNSFTNFADVYSYAITIGKREDGSAVATHRGNRLPHEVKDILRSVSIVMKKDEWLNLPPKKFITKIVQIPDDAREAYFYFARNWLLQLNGEEIEATNALGVMAKLTQISNGFIYSQGDDELDAIGLEVKPKKRAKRKTHFFSSFPKAERLLQLLREELVNRRVMIWFNMEAERVIIENALIAAGIEFLTVAGGDKKLNEKINQFNSKPKFRVLLCQAKTINYGVTVLGKDYDEEDDEIPIGITPEVFTQIFYSLNFSLEVFLQQQDRIHRIGQCHDCEYYILLSNTPTETKVKEAIDSKMSIRDYMLEDIIHSLKNLV